MFYRIEPLVSINDAKRKQFYSEKIKKNLFNDVRDVNYFTPCTHSFHLAYMVRPFEQSIPIVKQEVYYLPAIFMGCGVVERHLEMA